MRITWAVPDVLAELQRTTTRHRPGSPLLCFRAIIGNTYLYKLLPDGTPSREGDNEYPILDLRDTAVLGYRGQSFQRSTTAPGSCAKSGFFPKQWVIPVLEFLWDDPEVTAPVIRR